MTPPTNGTGGTSDLKTTLIDPGATTRVTLTVHNILLKSVPINLGI